MESVEIQNLEAKTIAIVDWLNLDGVPTALKLDPDNKLGIGGAFRKVDGFYADPIPPSVLEEAKNSSNSTIIPLMESQRIGEKVIKKGNPTILISAGKVISSPRLTTGGKDIPLFKEQVYATAQFLAKLGFEPKPKGGETFILGGQDPVKTYPTKDSKVKVQIVRKGTNENSPVSKIKLIINS